MYKDGIKLFAKKWKKKLETLIRTIRIYSQNLGIEFGIEKCALHIMKWKNRNNRRNGTAKSRKNQNAWIEGKLPVLGNIESGRHQQKEMKKKKKKESGHKKYEKNFLKPCSAVEISSKE